MPEQLLQNRHPLNSLCRLKLGQAKAEASPSFLYALQLMEWAVESGQAEIHPDRQPDLSDQVSAMLGWKPDNAMWFLLGDPSEDSPIDLREFQKLSPDQAATTLLDQLHRRMIEKVPEYRAPAQPLRG